MTERELTYRALLEIVQWVEKSDRIDELRLSYKGVALEIVKTSAEGRRSTSPVPRSETALPAEMAHPEPAAIAPAVQPAPPPIADGMQVVKAPMVGTFYRAPEPGARPFVQPGDTVTAGDTLCILEVMKLMNSLGADTAGVVREILVADGEVVEYGQPLIVIEPAR